GKNLAHGVFRRLRFIEERQAMAMECLACFGERETPRCAVYETHAELSLQRSDAAAELRGLQAQGFCRCRVGAEIDHFGEEIEVVEVLNGGHVAARIILCTTNMHSISGSVQGIIAQVWYLRVFVNFGGTQLCQVDAVNFWDSPLAQSQSLRPRAWCLHKAIPRAEGRRHKQPSLKGGRRNQSSLGFRLY